ncbi:hypothetical protein C6502_13260 [Candidatus Poribacteria bacterium]|nr:MAG: hypothetical protein C6502_13260 [Candidatus Poribacteria bacterium]
MTLGTYNANTEIFPFTLEANNQRFSRILYINRNDAPKLKNDWDSVVKTAYLSIDPGYRRGLAQVKLSYPLLLEYDPTWTFHEVYHLGDNHQAVAFSPDGKYIATGDDSDRTIWAVSSGEALRRTAHPTRTYAVAFSPDGQHLATTDRRYMSLWEVSNGKLVWRRQKAYSSYGFTRYAAFYGIAFSPDGQFLAGGNDRGVFVVDVNDGANFWGRTRSYSAYGSTRYAAFHGVAFSPDGQFLATGDTYGAAIIWDASNSAHIYQIEHSDDVWAVAFSPDGQYLATGDNAGNVSICEVSSGIKLKQMQHTGGWIGAVAFSPDGTYLAVGDESGVITFYRMGQGPINIDSEITKEKSIRASGAVYELAWHPYGNLISDGKKVYRTLLDSILTDLVAEPLSTPRDVNRDGIVDVEDLVLVASNFGKSFTVDANPNPDVNRDGVVDRADIIEIIISLEAAPRGPAASWQTIPTFTAKNLQHWINQAKKLNYKDKTFQKGIRTLEQLLATLIQAETTLLSNYPNPFNPETWIPYHLAEDAFVTLTIYDGNGQIVRTLDVGHRVAAVYENRSKAIYWDGRNEFGEQVASGVYFYHLSAGDYSATRKMLILK